MGLIQKIIYDCTKTTERKKDRLIRNNVNDTIVWSVCGSEIIVDIEEKTFDVKPNGLTLIFSFQ